MALSVGHFPLGQFPGSPSPPPHRTVPPHCSTYHVGHPTNYLIVWQYTNAVRRGVIVHKCTNDIEQAAANAALAVFGPHIATRDCVCHLCQSTWRKIQELGLAFAYKTNESIRHFCGSWLLFQYIQSQLLGGENKIAFESLVSYFDATHISGTVGRLQRPGDSGDVRLHLRRLPPLRLKNM